jgi:hypothetical protein
MRYIETNYQKVLIRGIFLKDKPRQSYLLNKNDKEKINIISNNLNK